MNYQIKTFDYFIFNGVAYGTGTQIELTEHVVQQYSKIMHEHQVVTFNYRMQTSSNDLCCVYKNSSTNKGSVFIKNNNQCIEKVIKPIYYKEKPALESAIENYESKKKKPDTFDQWVWYIFIMCFLAICKNGWIAMIVATVVFIKWLINQYAD